jgi:glyoxylase-like metal-dependent hydrolase (beta-lactamase superfamily II)
VTTFRVGDVSVTAVLESDAAFSPEFLRAHVLPDATREAVSAIPWLAPAWATADGELRFVTQALVVRSAGRVILVDTCLGNDKPRRNPAFDRLQTPFLARLAALGVAPEAVDLVVCTHLHFDHVGWNTRWDGVRWVPTFPRARYLVAEAEWDHWAARPSHGYVFADSLTPLADVGLLDRVALPHALTSEVTLVAAPGHTPGHAVVAIASRGQHAVITGDALHHPCQVARPDWTSPADSDRAVACATREALLADLRASGGLLIGTHFAHPCAGHVVGDRFIGARDEDAREA